jgi:oligopeptide transport system ATP-binding protein
MTSLLSVQGLQKTFASSRGLTEVHAVQGVDLCIEKGQIVGLVGESGCGKSTLGRCMLRLLEPSGGRILFEGTDITMLSRRELRPFRKKMQIVFQDPISSLNPRMTVGTIVAEPLIIHRLVQGGRDADRRVAHLLEQVGLSAAVMDRHPHEFSGGQRQRIGIARALAADPQFIVADEPVSALDVSVQAQIINLLAGLQRQRDLSYLFISHDLKVVRYICHHVAVMYLGRIVEQGPASCLDGGGRHPYTRALEASAPRADPGQRGERTVLQGEVPSPSDPPPGCVFHPRCPLYAERKNPICTQQIPELREINRGHRVACHEV